MIGGPIGFEWIKRCVYSKDVSDNHRYNYLRHRLWVKEIEKSKKS